MAVCNGDVCKSISHMMMNDIESTRHTFAAVKIKNLKQPLQKYNNKRVVDKLLQTIYR
jgi:hypothetical protein